MYVTFVLILFVYECKFSKSHQHIFSFSFAAKIMYALKRYLPILSCDHLANSKQLLSSHIVTEFLLGITTNSLCAFYVSTFLLGITSNSLCAFYVSTSFLSFLWKHNFRYKEKPARSRNAEASKDGQPPI